MDVSQIRKVLGKRKDQLLGYQGVVAIGMGYKVKDGKKTSELAVVCSVKKKVALSRLDKKDAIPAVLNGVQTDVVEVGEIKALHTKRYRPAPGGVSIGHVDITAGTLGCVVQQKGVRHILSNNHVLACSNDAKLGDVILQPGSYDGGTNPADHIANLADFVPIHFTDVPSNCSISRLLVKMVNGLLQLSKRNTRLRIVTQAKKNYVDAAIALPLKNDNIGDEILEIGQIKGTKAAFLGMKLKKSGRTTGLTFGEVTQEMATVKVQYGDNKVAQFDDQIMAGKMCKGGDSGSAVLSEDGYLTGLLFAGSENVTVINRFEYVFNLLNLNL